MLCHVRWISSKVAAFSGKAQNDGPAVLGIIKMAWVTKMQNLGLCWDNKEKCHDKEFIRSIHYGKLFFLLDGQVLFK